jgi:hypothetical protein
MGVRALFEHHAGTPVECARRFKYGHQCGFKESIFTLNRFEASFETCFLAVRSV